MNDDLRAQIRSRMDLKETGELLEIWQTNARAEWSDDAFKVIQEILQKRGVDIPEQNEPNYEHNEEKKPLEDYGFSDEELRIIDDKNPPVFYDPFDVLLAAKRINLMAKVMIGFIGIHNIFDFPQSMQIVQSYFIRNPNSPFVYVVTALLVALNAVISVVIFYVPLKALAHILRILMEMEFRSRKGIQPKPLVE